MFFISVEFIIFSIILIPLYFFLSQKYRWVLLLIASYIFYSFADIRFLIFLLTTTISTYLSAIYIDILNIKESTFAYLNIQNDLKEKYYKNINIKKNLCLIVVLIINLGMIFCFKQINIISDNLNLSNVLNLVLPLGISYYTLQALGYVIDVYRKVIRPEKNIYKYALFVSYFPQFVMGPISRFDDLSLQLFNKYSFNKDVFVEGIQRLVWGFFKKLVIADRIGIFVDTIYGNYSVHSGTVLVITMILYSVQIYADFSGYMDIAIGISKCLGIKIQENFNTPYFSKSVQEFWTRWHITLYTWFRDYVFYSLLRSNFFMKLKKILNGRSFVLSSIPLVVTILIVWFLVGLWHGSQPHYIVAGLYNGVLITLCLFIHKYNIFRNVKSIIKIIFTFMFISFGTFLFRINTLTDAINIINRVISCPFSDNIVSELNTNLFSVSQWYVLIISILILFIVDYIKVKNKQIKVNRNLKLFIIYLLLLSIVLFGKFGATTFIYLNF